MLKEVDIDLLELSPFRPRKGAPKVSAEEVEHVRAHGVIPPVVARPLPGPSPARYEILVGERSWMLAQHIGLDRIPVYIRPDLSDDEAREIVQTRWDGQASSDPIAEAQALEALLRAAPRSKISVIARSLGRSRTVVSHQLRLLKLCGAVQEMVRDGRLRPGHARPLIGLDPYDQIRIAREIVSKGLSARAAERLARTCQSQAQEEGLAGAAPAPQAKDQEAKSKDVLRLERELSERLGCGVKISQGRLIIDYYHDLEILDGVLERLGYQD